MSLQPLHLAKQARSAAIVVWICWFGLLSSAAFGQVDEPFGPLPRISFEAVPQQPWFNHPAVRQELNWSAPTHQRVVNTYGDLFSQYSDAVSQIPGNLSLPERRRREREITNTFHQDLNASLDKTLEDEAARRRYDELHLQYQGHSAVHHPEVRKRLDLSPEQRDLLAKECKEWDEAIGNYWKLHQTDPKRAAAEFEQAKAKLSERMTNTLNSGQQETWRQMTGKPFKFPADVYLHARPNDAKAKVKSDSAKDKK